MMSKRTRSGLGKTDEGFFPGLGESKGKRPYEGTLGEYAQYGGATWDDFGEGMKGAQSAQVHAPGLAHCVLLGKRKWLTEGQERTARSGTKIGLRGDPKGGREGGLTGFDTGRAKKSIFHRQAQVEPS